MSTAVKLTRNQKTKHTKTRKTLIEFHLQARRRGRQRDRECATQLPQWANCLMHNNLTKKNTQRLNLRCKSKPAAYVGDASQLVQQQQCTIHSKQCTKQCTHTHKQSNNYNNIQNNRQSRQPASCERMQWFWVYAARLLRAYTQWHVIVVNIMEIRQKFIWTNNKV